MPQLSRQFTPVDRITPLNQDPRPETMVRRMRNLYEMTPPDTMEKGMQWYDKVHQASAKGAHEWGRTTAQGAGVVAAVSPNMDWDSSNIDAISHLANFGPREWGAIQQSAQAGRRTDDVKAILKGTGLSGAYDSGLMKAHRIWNLGEDPDKVLPRSSAPKTNSFFHNILNPGQAGHVTVDGRHSDILVDHMRGWGQSRGISSAERKDGKPTRYERYQGATARAAKQAGVLPHEMQAVLWEHGKQIERNYNPARKKGDQRVGQSYQTRANAHLRSSQFSAV